MSVHPVFTEPTSTFHPQRVHTNNQDNDPCTKRAELASICRQPSAQQRHKKPLAASKHQSQAAAKAATIQQRDALVAAQMPQLAKTLQQASAAKLHKHLAKLRYRDLLDGAARDMALTPSPIFEMVTCAICREEMGRPVALSCGGRHQFCERCIIGTLEDGAGPGFRCPSCGEDVGEWYVARKKRICRREVAEFYGRVKRAIREAEKTVGIRRKWWKGVSACEVEEAVEKFVLQYAVGWS